MYQEEQALCLRVHSGKHKIKYKQGKGNLQQSKITKNYKIFG